MTDITTFDSFDSIWNYLWNVWWKELKLQLRKKVILYTISIKVSSKFQIILSRNYDDRQKIL